jgi:hypothetical protein
MGTCDISVIQSSKIGLRLGKPQKSVALSHSTQTCVFNSYIGLPIDLDEKDQREFSNLLTQSCSFSEHA